MAAANDLARMVPGFEFLQNLMKGAGAALPGMPGVPGMSQWIAPTLDPAELDKRIQELKTVQFWLESNAKLLGTTVQALEVQRMTLSTLQSMNLPLTDLRDALKINRPAPAPPPPAPEPEATEDDEEAEEEAEEEEQEREPAPAAKAAASKGRGAAGKKAAPAVVDPLQWWGALTQQFTELATKAVKDSTADAAKAMAGAAVKETVRQTMNTAGSTLKKAASLPGKAARVAGAAAGTLAGKPAPRRKSR